MVFKLTPSIKFVPFIKTRKQKTVNVADMIIFFCKNIFKYINSYVLNNSFSI